MIYILTGDIRTGKTTALLDWIKDRNDVDGLLCPDSENGMRYFLKVKSKEELFRRRSTHFNPGSQRYYHMILSIRIKTIRVFVEGHWRFLLIR